MLSDLGAGEAAGQDEHVVVGQVRLGQGEVAGDDDVVGGGDGPLGGHRDHRRRDAGAEEDVILEGNVNLIWKLYEDASNKYPEYPLGLNSSSIDFDHFSNVVNQFIYDINVLT